MKKNVTFLVFLTLIAFNVCAQNSGRVKGILSDTTSRQFLSNATVTILNGRDSSLVSFARTNGNGAFIIGGLENGNYRLLITHVGFRNVSKNFIISQSISEIDFGIILIANRSTVLEEVTVSQEKAPVTIKSDTIEFNAGSFKTKPNAVVEDLLKKLPGVQVDKDGKIKANGEEVKKVLVDGKEFFGNDPKMATKNLPADAVDKVQVFDRKSDQSRFTGFDDGNSEKTINLTIKPDKKNGLFGKATAGAGDNSRYQGNLNLNNFSGDRQFSAIGMANNTNKQGFSFLDILDFSGGLPGLGGRGGGSIQIDGNNSGLPIQGGNNNAGINTTCAGGLNYNDTWQRKNEFMSSYFFNRIETNKEEKVHQQWLLPGNNFNTDKYTLSNNRNENHRINFSSDYKLDTTNSIKLTSSLNIQHSMFGATGLYSSIAANGDSLNDGKATTYSKGNGFSWNNNALFRHRFGKKGRTFSASISADFNNSTSYGWLQSQNNYHQPPGTISDTINQTNDQNNKGNTYSAVLSYTEPLSKKTLLEFNNNLSFSHTTADKSTYDFDNLSGKHNKLNQELSNNFSSDYTVNRTGINFRFQQRDFNFAVGSAVQYAELKSAFHLLGQDSTLNRIYTNWLPNANLQYNISRYKNLRVFYNTYTRQPSVSQLQPVEDNTDPLYVKKGNPDLKQEYNQRLQANYMSFDPYLHTSFFAMLNISIVGNKIVNADISSAQGQIITQPFNANGVYTASLNTSWGFQVKKLKTNINLNSGISKNHTIGFLNGAKNNINTWTASQELSLTYSYKELLDINAGATAGYNNANYTLQKQQNTQYWNQDYSFETNLYLPKGFSIATDINYTKRSGLTQGYNTKAIIWNAGLAKQLFKNKKGEISIQVYDILNQNIGVNRSINQNYIEDDSYNVLQRFWQLSFTFNISRFAGKNIAAPAGRNNNIKVTSM